MPIGLLLFSFSCLLKDFVVQFILTDFAFIGLFTGSLAVKPKFLYPLTGPKRDIMYADLLERRSNMASRVSGADNEELARIAKAEINGEYVKNRTVD